VVFGTQGRGVILEEKSRIELHREILSLNDLRNVMLRVTMIRAIIKIIFRKTTLFEN